MICCLQVKRVVRRMAMKVVTVEGIEEMLTVTVLSLLIDNCLSVTAFENGVLVVQILSPQPLVLQGFEWKFCSLVHLLYS